MNKAEASWPDLPYPPKAEPRLPPLKFVAPFEFSDIPPTEFVYRDFYARGYTSLTIAAPKVGKSMLSLAEAIDMATGGKVFGVTVAKRRVAYVCAEDDQNVLDARCAATCLKHGIKVTELAETLVLQSGVDWPELFLISMDKARHQINEPVFDHLEQMVRNLNLDVIILDPLQDLSHAEESNDAFRALGQRLRLFASALNVSVALVHHTRKVAAGLTPSIDDARGGSALRGTSRFNRVLVGMSEDEGLRAGVDDARFFFRIGDVETNLAPPSSDRNQWFEKTGVDLPHGQSVGTLVKWKWPDEFEGITLDMAIRAREELAQMDKGAARHSVQASDWFGNVAARICNLEFPSDPKSRKAKQLRKRVNEILRQWEANGWIKCGETHDSRTGRTVKFYEAGDVHPNEA